MTDLFTHARKEQIERQSPLAARIRPRSLDEFVGQDEIVGPGKLLRRAIQADQLSSMIFWVFCISINSSKVDPVFCIYASTIFHPI